jgi:hypothetical protein
MPQNSHVLSRIACTNSTIIFAKSAVQYPVQLVLDMPMVAQRILKLFSIAGQA